DDFSQGYNVLFFQAEDGIRDFHVTGVQTCALPICAFGENYLQEAVEKITALKELDIEWHFIGHVQRNKTKHLAENFAWVHGVDRSEERRVGKECRPRVTVSTR